MATPRKWYITDQEYVIISGPYDTQELANKQVAEGSKVPGQMVRQADDAGTGWKNGRTGE